MDVLPLWLLYFLILAIILISTEVGWRLGNYRRQNAKEEKRAPVGAAVGATLGLLGFLLAFTFGMAAARHENRKQIVIQEANAIGTTYLRVDFIPEELHDEARNLLREYAALRAGGAASFMSPEGMRKSSSLHDQIWAIAANARTKSDTISTGLFIQSVNEMIDLDAVRVTAIRNRIPDIIWLMLCLVIIFSMSAMGYQFGLTGAHSWTVTILLAIVFTSTISMIADLERPQTGWVQVSQQPLIDLLNKIGTPMP